MKILFVASGYPGQSGGSMINMLVLTRALKELGHDVFLYKIDIGKESTIPMDIECSVIKMFTNIIPGNLKYFFNKKDYLLTNNLSETIERKNINLLIVYGNEALYLLDFKVINKIRKFILLGDPQHLVIEEKINNIINWLKTVFYKNPLLAVFKLANAIRNCLIFKTKYFIWKNVFKEISVFDWGYATASHHSKYYKTINPNIVYQPSPVLVAEDVDVLTMIEEKKKSEKINFLYIGHNLGGTSNFAGLLHFLKLFKVISNNEIFKNKFKVYIAGDISMLVNDVRKELESFEFVNVLGSIDISKYASDIHVLLNTIPHTLGNRTRIASLFAYGIPAISHVAAIFGMPSIKEKGVLLYEDDKSFSECVKKVISDKNLYYKLSQDAFNSYKELYSIDNLKATLSKVI